MLDENFVLPGTASAAQFRAQVEGEMDPWKALAESRGIIADRADPETVLTDGSAAAAVCLTQITIVVASLAR